MTEPTVGPWIEDHAANAREGDVKRMYLDGSGEAATAGRCDKDDEDEADGFDPGFCFIVWDRDGENVADQHREWLTFEQARAHADAALRERGEVLDDGEAVSRG